MEVKTTNALMKYLRDNHNIKIFGSKDKQNLINYGYYHGYKGYRFINKSSNTIEFSSFDECCSIINFDSNLKRILYPQLMQIETISKNRVLQLLVERYNTNEFNVIYDKGLTDYKRFIPNSKDYNESLSKRMRVHKEIYNALSMNYKQNNLIIKHFYSKDRYVPIWAIFEIISLGQFANLISCLETNTRKEISSMMKINSSFDTQGVFPVKIIFALKSLRNATAHNHTVFDNRFKDSQISNKISDYLEYEFDCKNINFSTITDYIILIVFLLKKYGISKREISKFILDFQECVDDFRSKIPISIFNRIMYSDTLSKIDSMKKFIKKS